MKLFKKTYRLYFILTILGIVCIGLGCGIAVFELSEYKTADYRSVLSDASLPQLKSEVITLEAPLSGSEPFKLDATHWNTKGYDIQYDNSLTDKVMIEVTAPEDIYNISLHRPDMQMNNYYYLECTSNEFSLMRLSLELAKQGYIPENYPPARLKLIMSEAQAKNFQLNEMRDIIQSMENTHYAEVQAYQEQHNKQITELTEQNEQHIQNL
ncbi:MAG: hypothetical protein IJA90_01135 [Peptococcaceae bacterium]|nr:hypothetical protein [Peptococcaceae bacterium]